MKGNTTAILLKITIHVTENCVATKAFKKFVQERANPHTFLTQFNATSTFYTITIFKAPSTKQFTKTALFKVV
jgi:3-phenylpropionate/cinnamic acid dioxygenase small subunit